MFRWDCDSLQKDKQQQSSRELSPPLKETPQQQQKPKADLSHLKTQVEGQQTLQIPMLSQFQWPAKAKIPLSLCASPALRTAQNCKQNHLAICGTFYHGTQAIGVVGIFVFFIHDRGDGS